MGEIEKDAVGLSKFFEVNGGSGFSVIGCRDIEDLLIFESRLLKDFVERGLNVLLCSFEQGYLKYVTRQQNEDALEHVTICTLKLGCTVKDIEELVKNNEMVIDVIIIDSSYTKFETLNMSGLSGWEYISSDLQILNRKFNLPLYVFGLEPSHKNSIQDGMHTYANIPGGTQFGDKCDFGAFIHSMGRNDIFYINVEKNRFGDREKFEIQL